MNDCVFCKILANELPSHKVYEDDVSYAFLDINPSTAGHTLIIPKKHYATFTEMPEEDLSAYMISVQKVCKGIEKLHGAFNLLRNNGKAAGEFVPHVHFHVVPRQKGDGIEIGHWRKAENVDMEKVQEKIKSLLKE